MSALVSQFHFLRPLWLLALLALPLLLWRWQHRRAASDPWRAACDPHLLPHLLQSGVATGTRWLQTLFAFGFVLAVLALAGPAFRQLPQALSRAESALIIALDLSDRMRATDLKPNRLTRARYKIADLMKSRREGQTALIAYAGDAFVVAPLTDDANSLSDLLASLSPETMPVVGQRAERAIVLAQRLLHDAGFERGDLLLVTDATDARASRAAEAAAAAGLRVSVLGVGTAVGAPVALPQGGFAQDEDGNVLLPRLDADSLRSLAQAGKGRYASVSVDGSDLAALNLIEADALDANLRSDERTRAEYHDEGPWLLLALLPLAALAFRRGWLACALVALCLPAPRADAFEWSSLWQRDDQRAYDALQSDQAARALELARDPALRGSAAYRAEDYAQAEAAFAQQPEADSRYNRGNALAKSERYQEALAAYDEALQQAPEMEDARANRQAVEDWLKQQKQQKNEQGDSQQQPSPGEQGESQPQKGDPQEGQSEDSETSPSSQGEPQKSESESGEEENSAQQAEPADEKEQQQAQQQFAEQMEQALKDGKAEPADAGTQPVDPRETEKQQAVEQWLRRVPDDPGGLLRRKFALEHQRRLREGQGE